MDKIRVEVSKAAGSSVGRVVGCIAVGTVVAGAATVAIPAVAGLVGFTSAGISAGSVAAGLMSAAWKAGQGVWLISTLQSVGAAGVGLKTAAVTGVVAAKATDVLTKKK
eukprot:TRINITY_DN16583_c0_g1_i2.p1 TRINITY_DN16583_c0_g1~~TRINITY_DN16583_c0_g1_i2.p1  ORF type:complete len:109 (+),score=21.21 TRINITY_DN16583_c0_g1_i2:185-511(+)